jgi:hypothetical protein
MNKELVFIYEGWRKTDGKGGTFKGSDVSETEYKIMCMMLRAFLPQWEVIGIWKNKFNNYLIQLRTAEKVSGGPGGEDHYYTYLVITEDGKLAGSSYYNLKKLLEESVRNRFK